MTPGTIEKKFSEILQTNLHEVTPLDLTLEGPPSGQEHPQVIKARLEYEVNPEREPAEVNLPGWFYESFETLFSAESKYPDIKLKFIGKPWSIYQFLSGNTDAAIIDFPGIGTAVVSKEPLPPYEKKGLHHHVVPLWLAYALSPELWGPNGKWIRFHENLHELFRSRDLLAGTSTLGYYTLKSDAEKIETHGFTGTKLEKAYLIVLPWTFSLTALKKLENIIRQEF